ncbi:hypothetical protein FS749_009049 [Ceratobasidium sp. UAMH 11750]|nr:hypothetical protein FS749_009049 [Ceratobasidium sp. UAMH 11750]
MICCWPAIATSNWRPILSNRPNCCLLPHLFRSQKTGQAPMSASDDRAPGLASGSPYSREVESYRTGGINEPSTAHSPPSPPSHSVSLLSHNLATFISRCHPWWVTRRRLEYPIPRFHVHNTFTRRGNQVNVIDFGLAKEFRDPKTHLKLGSVGLSTTNPKTGQTTAGRRVWSQSSLKAT